MKFMVSTCISCTAAGWSPHFPPMDDPTACHVHCWKKSPSLRKQWKPMKTPQTKKRNIGVTFIIWSLSEPCMAQNQPIQLPFMPLYPQCWTMGTAQNALPLKPGMA
jgi:hypothetical protein